MRAFQEQSEDSQERTGRICVHCKCCLLAAISGRDSWYIEYIRIHIFNRRTPPASEKPPDDCTDFASFSQDDTLTSRDPTRSEACPAPTLALLQGPLVSGGQCSVVVNTECHRTAWIWNLALISRVRPWAIFPPLRLQYPHKLQIDQFSQVRWSDTNKALAGSY